MARPHRKGSTLTVIVGLIIGDHVMIGGDSMALDLHTFEALLRAGDEKVFRKGPYLMGATGSFKIVQLLNYHLQLEDPPQTNIYPWIATYFIPTVQATFAKCRYSAGPGESFLVGFGCHLFRIRLEDYQFVASSDGYDAIGSGGPCALGSLHATAQLGVGPAERMWLALTAAVHHNRGVVPPFYILDTAHLFRPGLWPPDQGDNFVLSYETDVGVTPRGRA
jgi:hypothetical protein